MKKVTTFLFGLLLLIWLLFSLIPLRGGGDTVVAQYGTTMRIIQDAIGDKSGTWAFENGRGMYLFAKAIENGVGIVGIDINSTPSMFSVSNGTLQGCISDCKTISDMLTSIQNNGWKAIAGSQVPSVLRTFVKTSAFLNLVQARGMGDILVVPVFPFVNPPDGMFTEGEG